MINMVITVEIAYIKTKNRIYHVFCDDLRVKPIEIYGYYLENDKFHALDSSLFNEFSKFKLGNNFKKLKAYLYKDKNYDVFLDIDTKFKHYFYNGVEDKHLFLNNFKPVANTLYEISNDAPDKKIGKLEEEKKNAKKFMIVIGANITVLCSILLATVIDLNSDKYQQEINNLLTVSASKSTGMELLLNETPELNKETIVELINNNPNLDENSKTLFLNDKLLDVAVPYLQEDKDYCAILYNFILPNLTIEDAALEDGVLGKVKDITIIAPEKVSILEYLEFSDTISIDNIIDNYASYYPSTIYMDSRQIKDVDQQHFDEVYNECLLHEWIHLLQPNKLEYTFLVEGNAEIFSNEYSSTNYLNAYHRYRKYIKSLMEIIGAEPIVAYNFSGNFDYIAQELEKYLSKEELEELEYYTNWANLSEDSTMTLDDFFDYMDSFIVKLNDIKNKEDINSYDIVNSYLTNGPDSVDKYYFNIDDTSNLKNDLHVSTSQNLGFNENLVNGYLDFYNIPTSALKNSEERNSIFKTINRNIETSSILNNGLISIMEKEYYGIENTNYKLERKTIKILSDIIGKEAIQYYCYAGSYELIVQELSKYLTKQEVEQFMTILLSNNPPELRNNNEEILNNSLCHLYNIVNGTNQPTENFINNCYASNDKIYLMDGIDTEEINKKK